MGERRERQGFSIWWALVASLLFHAAFVLVVWLVPFESGASELEPEQRIEFTFEPQPEPAVETPAIETPPPPAPEPVEQALPELNPPAPEREPDPNVPVRPPPAERQDEPGDGLPAGGSPSVPRESPRSEPSDAVEPKAEPPVEQTTDAVAGLELPGTAEELLREGPTAPSRPPGSVVDLERALKDFERIVEQARRPDEEAAPTVFSPEIAALPQTGHGIGNLVFESGDYDWAASGYDSQVYIAIWRAWHNRLYQTVDAFERWAHGRDDWLLSHQNLIEFTIESNGDVSGIRVLSPAGSPPMDASAVNALDEVVLPPLPGDFPRRRETVRAHFIMTGNVRAMRQVLTHYKRAGYF